jgi:hypothetical protein
MNFKFKPIWMRLSPQPDNSGKSKDSRVREGGGKKSGLFDFAV